MSISIVIPIFKGEPCLYELYNRTEKALNHFTQDWEIIFVNDGSPDNSWSVIEKLASNHKNIIGLKLLRNFGQHNALLAGVRTAKKEIIITIDDDLQNPPEEIEKLYNKIGEGYDVVYGVPIAKRHSLLRNFSSQMIRIALSSVMDAKSARNVSSFRAFKKSIISCFQDYKGDFVSIDALLSWGAKSLGVVDVHHDERREGVSNYSFKKLINYSLTMMTSYSALPLKLASFIGFVCTAFGLCVLIYVVGKFLIQGGSVPGFPFLASIIAVFSGAQLFSLGILGEYLGRIHFRSMGKPSYVIEQITCSSNEFRTQIEKAS